MSIEVEGGGLVAVSQVKDGHRYTHLCHMASGQVLDAEVQPEPVHVADKVPHNANDAKRVTPSAALTVEDFSIPPGTQVAREVVGHVGVFPVRADTSIPPGEVRMVDMDSGAVLGTITDVGPADDSAELLKLASTIPTDGESAPAPATPPADTPKRRGRPPKVRPAE